PDCLNIGCGVVYRLNAAGQQTVLYRFTGGLDGAEPVGGGIRDAGGNLYRTTPFGGRGPRGRRYKPGPGGPVPAAQCFAGGAAAGRLRSGVIREGAGNLYGTAMNGGIENDPVCFSGCGVIFKIDPSGHETVLYSFTGGSDGGLPEAGVIADPAGNLYGTTSV